VSIIQYFLTQTCRMPKSSVGTLAHGVRMKAICWVWVPAAHGRCYGQKPPHTNRTSRVNLVPSLAYLWYLVPWLAMSANVSVSYTPQTTDIFVCCRRVGNVVPTRRQHSVMSAGVVSVRPIADTHSYMFVGISIDEAVTTYKTDRSKTPH
jgi:hypothetical protein